MANFESNVLENSGQGFGGAEKQKFIADFENWKKGIMGTSWNKLTSVEKNDLESIKPEELSEKDIDIFRRILLNKERRKEILESEDEMIENYLKDFTDEESRKHFRYFFSHILFNGLDI